MGEMKDTTVKHDGTWIIVELDDANMDARIKADCITSVRKAHKATGVCIVTVAGGSFIVKADIDAFVRAIDECRHFQLMRSPKAVTSRGRKS